MANDLTNDINTDVRLIERNLAKGFLSRANADKLVNELPDVADKADYIDIDGDGTADDDDADDSDED